MSHQNNGACPKCVDIFNAYSSAYPTLRNWFLLMQSKFPEFHVSCVGRGKIDQEDCFNHHTSKAHWTESAHNWNAALDGWFLIDETYNLDRQRFEQVAVELPDYLEWYGNPGAKFPELPHFEVKNWRDLASRGILHLVE